MPGRTSRRFIRPAEDEDPRRRETRSRDALLAGAITSLLLRMSFPPSFGPKPAA
jgi:hypothetical protein